MHSAKRQHLAQPPESQVDICYRWIRDEIVMCRISPGQRFTERELMVRAGGVGRTPLREALLRLQQEGLVTALPRSGYEATPVTEKTVNDLFDVWRPIGPLIGRLAFSRMTPEIREQIRRLDEVDLSTLDGRFQVSDRLFELLLAAAQNDDLDYIFRRLSGNIRRVFIVLLASDLGGEWLRQGGAMAKFALTTDPDSAAAHIADAISRSYRSLLEVLHGEPTADVAVPGAATPVRAGPARLTTATKARARKVC